MVPRPWRARDITGLVRILFGLSMDYEIFLLSSIREEPAPPLVVSLPSSTEK